MTAIPVAKNTVVPAMILMAAAMLLAPVVDAVAKYLAVNFAVSPAMVTFSRFLVQSLFLLVFIGVAWMRRDLAFAISWLNILRGMLMGLAALMFFTAIKYMPLADAIAVFFVEPLILMLLSSMFLGEVIGWRRRIAAIIGFCGALIVIQPSYALFGPVSLLPLCTAFLFAVYLVLTRKAGADDDPVTMQFFAGLGGVVLCGAVMMIGTPLGIEDLSFTLPDQTRGWALLLAIGLLATATHLLIVMAFSMAAASILAPFQYLEIITATLLGFILFNDFPEPAKWLGIFIIIGSGLYSFLRERSLEMEDKSTPYHG